MPHSPLRDYQVAAVDDARLAIAEGCRSLILESPTGSGKSLMIRDMAERAARKGFSSYVVAPRREIISQMSRHYDEVGLDHGILQADHPRRRPGYPIQIATTATLLRRDVPEPSIIFRDEAHLGLQATLTLRERFPNAIFIGTTATPCRLDGRPLGSAFQRIIRVATVADLIQRGYLCPYVAFQPPWDIDLSSIPTMGGDYHRHKLAARVARPSLTGDAVATWLEKAEGRSTIVFCVDVAHMTMARDQYRAKGVDARMVHAKTPDAERDKLIAEFSAGVFPILCNVEIATYGLDVPRTACIQILRPTQSVAIWMQMQGRGLRIFPGKRDLLLLDHAGMSLIPEFGLPDDPHEWTLEGGHVKRKTTEATISIRRCGKCFRLARAGTAICPHCGTPFPIYHRPIIQRAGELQQATRARPALCPEAPDEQRVRTAARWFREAAKRQYKNQDGWVKARYMAVFGRWMDPETERKARVGSGSV